MNNFIKSIILLAKLEIETERSSKNFIENILSKLLKHARAVPQVSVTDLLPIQLNQLINRSVLLKSIIQV